MKRPGPAIYLFGNPVTLLVLGVGTLYLAYLWWTNQGSAGPAVIAFLGLGYSASCNNQLQKYNEWKQEWDAMGGKAPGASAAAILSRPAVRFFVVFVIWCVWAVLTFSVSGDPSMKLAVWLFWLATVVMIVGGVMKFVRRPKAATKTVAFKDLPVSVCIPLPKQSPTAQQAFDALPAYCTSLFPQTRDEHASVKR